MYHILSQDRAIAISAKLKVFDLKTYTLNKNQYIYKTINVYLRRYRAGIRARARASFFVQSQFRNLCD